MASSTAELFAGAASGHGCLLPPCARDASIVLLKVVSGYCVVQIGTSRKIAKEGDIFYVPPRMTFSVMSYDFEDASIRYLVFDSLILSEAMDSFDAGLLSMFYVQSRIHISAFSVGHPAYEMLDGAIREAYDEYAAKDVCYRLAMRSAVCHAMTVLLRYYCGAKDESSVQVYHNVMRLLPAVDYIDAHCGEKIYIEKLSALIGITPDHFTKVFRDAMGTTPVDYINAVRVNRAMRLLIETDQSIADVAMNAGFANANYFHKIFKTYMEDSPLVYRKRK